MSQIAVLIPVYNDQTGLDKSISSFLHEIPLDIFIIDDGSEPKIIIKENVIKNQSQHQFFLYRLDTNQGIVSALNFGLSLILQEGYEFVARLDAGDTIIAGRFEHQACFLKENPEYSLVGGQANFLDLNGCVKYEEEFPCEFDVIKRFIYSRSCFLHSAIFLRTSVFKETGLYSHNYDAAEDYELYVRLVSQGYKCCNLDCFVINYYINPCGISLSKRRRQLLSRLKVIIKYFQPLEIYSWIGVLKHVILLILPVSLVTFLKRRMKFYRGWI